METQYYEKSNHVGIKFLADCFKEDTASYPPRLIVILINYFKIGVISPLTSSESLFIKE